MAELESLTDRGGSEKRARRQAFDLERRVHEAETAVLGPDPPRPAHALSVTLEPDTYTDEKYRVYDLYQRIVHNDPHTAAGFARFLCDSPLGQDLRSDGSDLSAVRRVGSYHQVWRLDGVLIAFSVLDLTPGCVSAVYFVYDPDSPAAEFSLGRISCLREIAFAREGGYGFYYMGYHIPASKKMMYKSDFRPQMVLDLCRLELDDVVAWDYIDDPHFRDKSKGIRHLLARDAAHSSGSLPAYLVASRIRHALSSLGRDVPIELIHGSKLDLALAHSPNERMAILSILSDSYDRARGCSPGSLSQSFLSHDFDFGRVCMVDAQELRNIILEEVESTDSAPADRTRGLRTPGDRRPVTEDERWGDDAFWNSFEGRIRQFVSAAGTRIFDERNFALVLE